MKKNGVFLIATTLTCLSLFSCGQEGIPEPSYSNEDSSSEIISSSSETSSEISSSTILSSSEIVSSEATSPSSSSSSSSKSSIDPNYPTSLSGCSRPQKVYEFEQKGYSTLYKDLNFAKGLTLSKPSYGPGESPWYDEPLRLFPSLAEPVWTLAQWGSRFDFYGTDERGGYTLESTKNGLCNRLISKGEMQNGAFVAGKVIEFDSTDGSIYMESNNCLEYDSPRVAGQDWPAILLNQGFGDNLVHIEDCESIVMDADYRIDYCTDHMGTYADKNKHAAQAVWYITLQNRNRASKDYGKYIWFGINLWDNRTSGKATSIFRQVDAGTSALMYNPGTKDYMASGIHPIIGERAEAKIEITEIAREALAYGKANGFLTNTDFSELYIGGTNFGFETPGTYDIGATFFSVNVFYKYKAK